MACCGARPYKNLANDAAGRQSRVGLAWMHSELQTEIAALTTPPTAQAVRERCAGSRRPTPRRRSCTTSRRRRDPRRRGAPSGRPCCRGTRARRSGKHSDQIAVNSPGDGAPSGCSCPGRARATTSARPRVLSELSRPRRGRWCGRSRSCSCLLVLFAACGGIVAFPSRSSCADPPARAARGRDGARRARDSRRVGGRATRSAG